MARIFVALTLIAAASAVAYYFQRRRPEPPTQAKWAVPSQLDRDDFDGGARPWLVAVFTSATCNSCKDVVPKALVLESSEVSVVEVPYQTSRDIHDRYAVDIVPLLVVADAEGVVRASFIGTPTATDLWAAVAELRTPRIVPEPHLGHPDPTPYAAHLLTPFSQKTPVSQLRRGG